MTKHPVILVIFLFALHAFASPWRPFGSFKRAPSDEHQNEGRGGSFYGAYGDWPPTSEIHGPQLSDWNTPSVATTERPLETSPIFPQYSCKTTTAQPSAITSSEISTAHEATETQQVPTTILSIVTSQGSCTPAGPVIPPATVTQKETTTIYSTITGPAIVSTQIVSATGQTAVVSPTERSALPVPPVTQTIVSTEYYISTLRSVYTETEWSAATATVKSAYTETETTILPGQIVTTTQFATLPGPTITSIQYQVSTITLPVQTYTETSTVYQGHTVTQTVVSTYTCTETETLVSTAVLIQQTTALKTEFYTSTVYPAPVKTIVSTYTAQPFTTAIVSTVSEVHTIIASASCTQAAPVIPCSAATSTSTVTHTVSGQRMTVTETGKQICPAIVASRNCTHAGAMITVYSTIASCASPTHIQISGSCTHAGPIIPGTTITATSTERASCSAASAQTSTVYSTIISTAQASCGSKIYIQTTWATTTETQPRPTVYPTPSTVTVTETKTAVGSQTSEEAGWATSAGYQAAPPVYGATSASAW